MLFKCYQCGHIFEDGEELEITETHNLDGGIYEKYTVCPICKGFYSKAQECAVCGKLCTDEELTEGVCEDCFDAYAKDFDTCYNLSLGEEETVKINPVLAFALDPADINAILKDYIKKKCPDVDWSEFARQDKGWFCEQLAKEVKK